MNKIEEILDECLEQIRRGADLESCLASHPEEAPILRPLLETALSLKSISMAASTISAHQKGREAMFAAVAQTFPSSDSHQFVQQAVSPNAFSRYSVRLLTWITGKETVDMKLATRLTSAMILALIVIVGLGTTTVSASNALPGDFLYSLKTSAQSAQLMFTWDSQVRQELEKHFQEEYRDDILTLATEGREASVQFVGEVDEIGDTQWVVGGLTVTIDSSTTITGDPQVGDMVQVQAAIQSDGTILASAISLFTPEHDPDEEHPTHTYTPTASPTNTPTNTPTGTLEATSEYTPTPTVSTTPCPTDGTGHHDGGNGYPVPSGTYYPTHLDDHHNKTLTPMPTQPTPSGTKFPHKDGEDKNRDGSESDDSSGDYHDDQENDHDSGSSSSHDGGSEDGHDGGTGSH